MELQRKLKEENQRELERKLKEEIFFNYKGS